MMQGGSLPLSAEVATQLEQIGCIPDTKLWRNLVMHGGEAARALAVVVVAHVRMLHELYDVVKGELPLSPAPWSCA